MPTLQALIQLLDHERRARDEALQALSHAEGTAGQAEAQAQALNTYRSDYVERWSARFREPGSVALMQCYQGFMQRLEQAIVQQRHAQAQAKQRVDQFFHRRQQQEQRLVARREQVRTDETAQRAHARRIAAQPDHGESHL